VDQLRRARRRRAGEITFVHKRNAKSTQRSVAGDRGTVDTAADYRKIEGFGAQPR
jgi:hypothetical protein